MSMSFDTRSSVQALRAEAEANRARLTGTVGDLRMQVEGTATDLKERLSPSAIKAEVKDYVRGSRDQLWHSLEQKARDNPLQAVAVGAALAFPALRLLQAMPAPLLLVGAGLLLSKSQGDSMSQGADAVRDRARSAVDGVTDATDSARRKLHDTQDSIREGMDSLAERAAAATSSIKERVGGTVDDAKVAVGELADKVVGQGEGVVQQARTVAATAWDRNPLLVAGAGLLIGGIIAAAFPATQTEENLFGDATDALRRQAEGVAAKGVDAARKAVDTAAGAASEQGLSAEGLAGLGESLTDKVRAVAERGVEAALGETKTTNTQEGTRTR